MRLVSLGRTDMKVSILGLGCMGMSEQYGPSNDAENLATLNRALEIGVNFFDTADIYGPFTNETLIGRSLVGRRDSVVLATKCGIVRNADGSYAGIDNSAGYIRSSCEASLRRLGIEAIDLYYLHRVDPTRPIEEAIGVMADLVRQGKVRAIGLSEVSARTLYRAAAVYPITALQSEYSLWTRDPETEVLGACRSLGTSFVAFAPLGRGFLTGEIRDVAALTVSDYRRSQPRFQGAAAVHNAALVRRLERIAISEGCTAPQLALAWLLAKSPDVVPIPGTRRIHRLEENARAAAIRLSPTTLADLDAAFPPGAAAGARYDAEGMQSVNV